MSHNANSGRGMFQMEGIDSLVKDNRCDFDMNHTRGSYTYTLVHVSASNPTNNNDGMNCVGQELPFLTADDDDGLPDEECPCPT